MCYCTNSNSKSFTLDEYKQFMFNKDNEYNCEACPENRGMTSAGYIAGPCGQQNCWVTCHCR